MRNFLITTVIAFFLTSAPAIACDLRFDNSVSPIDRTIACKAANIVEDFYADIGYPINLTSHIVFQQYLFAADARTNGKYFPAEDIIFVMRDRAGEFGPSFGIPINSEINASIIEHEMHHAAIFLILGENATSLNRGFHEFLAYCGQFNSMRPALREEILAASQDAIKFQMDTQINDIVYAIAEPIDFAAKSWLTCSEAGVKETFQRVLSLNITQIDLNSLL